MKTYVGVEVKLHEFLTAALDGAVVRFTPGRFTPWERAPGTSWIGGWVGPITGLYPSPRKGACLKGKVVTVLN